MRYRQSVSAQEGVCDPAIRIVDGRGREPTRARVKWEPLHTHTIILSIVVGTAAIREKRLDLNPVHLAYDTVGLRMHEEVLLRIRNTPQYESLSADIAKGPVDADHGKFPCGDAKRIIIYFMSDCAGVHCGGIRPRAIRADAQATGAQYDNENRHSWSHTHEPPSSAESVEGSIVQVG